MRYIYLSLLILLTFSVTACSIIAPNVDSIKSSEYPLPSYPDMGQNYPYPFSAYVSPTSPYPQPQSTEPTFFATLGPVPTPGKDLGIVTGRLFSNKKPVHNVTLYLAELAKDDKGTETIASFSPSTSPWAFTDEDGKFVFPNIKPGRYSLVLDLAIDSILLNKPGEDKSFTLTVEPGKTTDLGDLYYTNLPTTP